MTCHGDSSFPLIAVPCEEDSDFLVTTTCVTVVLKGKLLELEVDVERDDEGLEPDNDVSQHYIVVSIDICGLSVSRPNGVEVAVVKNTSLLAVDELRFLLLLLLCSIPL